MRSSTTLNTIRFRFRLRSLTNHHPRCAQLGRCEFVTICVCALVFAVTAATAAAAARLLALAPVAPAAPGALVEPAGAAAYAVEAGAWVIVVAAAATAAAAALRVVPAYVAAGSVYAA